MEYMIAGKILLDLSNLYSLTRYQKNENIL